MSRSYSTYLNSDNIVPFERLLVDQIPPRLRLYRQKLQRRHVVHVSSVLQEDDVDMRREHLVGYWIVHVAFRILGLSAVIWLWGRTLKKFNLINCVVSRGFPETGSTGRQWIQSRVRAGAPTGLELPDIGNDVQQIKDICSRRLSIL